MTGFYEHCRVPAGARAEHTGGVGESRRIRGKNPDRRQSTHANQPFYCAQEVGLDDMEVAAAECLMRSLHGRSEVERLVRTPNLYVIVIFAALAVLCVGELNGIASISALHFQCC